MVCLLLIDMNIIETLNQLNFTSLFLIFIISKLLIETYLKIRNINSINRNREKIPERFIEVEWDFAKNSSFLIRLKIEIEDRKHLLKDLTESTKKIRIRKNLRKKTLKLPSFDTFLFVEQFDKALWKIWNKSIE